MVATEETGSLDGDEVDTALMLRLRAGEDVALNPLMDRWQTPLVSFILRYTGNKEDALDLAQETFARIYEHRGSYKPQNKFSSWLFTIATNLCHNHARWKKRHPTVTLHSANAEEESGGLEASLPASGDTPADSAERNDLANAVRAHVQMLPHDLKTIVLLFEFQNLGYSEIAAAVGCTPKAVETRLYRARKILHDSLSHWRIDG